MPKSARPSYEQLQAELAAAHKEITRLSLSLRTALRAATTDPLTGLHNRNGFDNDCFSVTSAAKSQDQILFIGIVDIDHFKSVNDTLGHAVGDESLKKVAGQLSIVAEEMGFHVARLGGEEFALVGISDKIDVAVMAKTLGAAIQNNCAVGNNGERKITASIGLTLLNPTDVGDNLSEALKRADTGLYVAKETGRNHARVVPPDYVDGDSEAKFTRIDYAPTPSPATRPARVAGVPSPAPAPGKAG